MGAWDDIKNALANYQGPTEVREKAMELARVLGLYGGYTSWLLYTFGADSLTTALIALAGDLTCTCTPEKKRVGIKVFWSLTKVLRSLQVDVSFRKTVEACVEKLAALGIEREKAQGLLIGKLRDMGRNKGGRACMLPKAAYEAAVEAGINKDLVMKLFFYENEARTNQTAAQTAEPEKPVPAEAGTGSGQASGV